MTQDRMRVSVAVHSEIVVCFICFPYIRGFSRGDRNPFIVTEIAVTKPAEVKKYHQTHCHIGKDERSMVKKKAKGRKIRP